MRTVKEIENEIEKLKKEKAVIEENERKELDKKKNERYKEAVEAFEKFAKLKKDFIRDYGYWYLENESYYDYDDLKNLKDWFYGR